MSGSSHSGRQTNQTLLGQRACLALLAKKKIRKRPKGARILLSESVLKELINHLDENGLDAVYRNSKEQPEAYLRAVLSLAPKRFFITVERDEPPQHIEISFFDFDVIRYFFVLLRKKSGRHSPTTKSMLPSTLLLHLLNMCEALSAAVGHKKNPQLPEKTGTQMLKGC